MSSDSQEPEDMMLAWAGAAKRVIAVADPWSSAATPLTLRPEAFLEALEIHDRAVAAAAWDEGDLAASEWFADQGRGLDSAPPVNPYKP